MKNDAGLSKTTHREMPENTAGLLCYAGGWISGIIFLVLEQKSRFVRFHALQSIMIFGVLTLAGIVLEPIPYAGPGLGWTITALGFALWLILMLKAYSGEVFKMPWAGNLAEKLASESKYQTQDQPLSPLQPLKSPAAHSAGDDFRSRYYTFGRRAGRTVASSFAIAWSIALFIFFNFYSQYVAYYTQSNSGGASAWQMYTLITSDFNSWLPVVNTALALGVVGHVIMIVLDKYIVRQMAHIVLSVFGLAAVVTLLAIFPFNFDVIPNPDIAFAAQTGTTIALVLAAVGFGIGALVRFIQLIVNLAQGKY
jgi:uncharacterized membrane protein